MTRTVIFWRTASQVWDEPYWILWPRDSILFFEIRFTRIIVTVDNRIATIAIIIIIIIIFFFTNCFYYYYYYYYYYYFHKFLLLLLLLLLLFCFSRTFLLEVKDTFLVFDKYYFIILISWLSCIRTAILRLRSVNIRLLLQIRSGDLMRSVTLFVVVGMWFRMAFQ
jgi:hypothetical protein